MIAIDGRAIGPDHPPYVICELSANHNGSLERALAMIDAAAATGADAVKIQTYTPDTLTIDCAAPEFRIADGPWAGRTLHDLYAEAFTPYEWHEALFARARALGITLFSSPFDETAVELLDGLGSPAFKIASFEVIDLPLIAYTARKGKPMIISTGMASLAEIDEAVRTAREHGCDQLALLHCVSSYPAPDGQSNIRTIPHLSEAFGCVTGLSDHTHGTAVATASIALGGAIVEKHFTLARADGGPDSAFSLEPDEFSALVADCKRAWTALGRVDYALQGCEKGSMVFRRSIYVVEDIAEGAPLTERNTRSIRPGYGLPPKLLPRILGSTATRDLARGTALREGMFAAASDE